MKTTNPFHILLTNDDGHAAPGIRTMQSALLAQGYRVSLVAPSQEQSATSMSTTTRRNMPLESTGEGGWHLDAQPADTVLVALRHLLRDDPPDLVVSGINFGPNLGIGLHASGTIGAAMIALLDGFPAIAVSAGMLFEEALQSPPRFPSTHRVLEPAARVTGRLVLSDEVVAPFANVIAWNRTLGPRPDARTGFGFEITTADAKGRFELQGLSAGLYDFGAGMTGSKEGMVWVEGVKVSPCHAWFPVAPVTLWSRVTLPPVVV